MFSILLMIILLIIIFIIILLYIGVKITLIYDKTGRTIKGCLKILIFKKIKIYSVNLPNDDITDEEDETEDEEHDLKKLFDLAKPCYPHIKEFLKSFVKCIKVSKLENHLIFGLDSYAKTATYIGYIWSLIIIINSSHENAKLSAEPSFNGSVLDINGDNELDINILKLIPPVVKLISKKEIHHLIRGLING